MNEKATLVIEKREKANSRSSKQPRKKLVLCPALSVVERTYFGKG